MPTHTPYQPISCDFHDILEATATRRTVARIEFVDDDGVLRQRDARIVDFATGSTIEYMTLETGERVRLDRIVSIDGVRLAGFDPPGDRGQEAD